METKKLNEGMMALLLEEEAWKELSKESIWNEQLLEKHQDKLDWEGVCYNSSIHWTVSMLEKFRRRIDWKALSNTSQESLLSPEVVEKFADCWDWSELSKNSCLPVETIEKMADRIVWKELLNSWRNDGLFSGDFLRKYESHISASILKGSNLWGALVEKKKAAIQKAICLG